MENQYSIELWRTYCDNRVEITSDQQKQKIKRLLSDPDACIAWSNLAGSVRPLIFTESDGQSYVLGWREALHNVLSVLLDQITPAKAPGKSDYAELKEAILKIDSIIQKNAANGKWFVDESGVILDMNLKHGVFVCDLGERGLLPQPLMPGKKTALSQRNWIALYLRDRIIKPFFSGQHHEDVARLVNVALELYKDGDRLTEQDVRKLRQKNSAHP